MKKKMRICIKTETTVEVDENATDEEVFKLAIADVTLKFTGDTPMNDRKEYIDIEDMKNVEEE